MSAAKLTDVISNLANGNISVQTDHSASQNDHGEGTSHSPEVAAAAEKAAKDNSKKKGYCFIRSYSRYGIAQI